ncbi:MAG: germination protein YpeB [Clostridiales bacterium]|nr:germination protein YpeB [Clostridiales bacterium]
MTGIKYKRLRVRFASYIIAAILVLGVWGITQTVKAASYSRQLSIDRQRAVSSLASYLDSVETDLRKMQYVNTETMASGLALSLSRSSAGAKSCLSQLATGETELYNIYKFLSQAGDYVRSVDKKLISGGSLSDEDREQIKALYEYSVSLSDTASYVEELMYAGEIEFEDTVSTLSMISEEESGLISFYDTVSDTEESFSDYPTLIYDGPYSDNITSKTSELLENESEITAEEAKELAAEYSGIDKNRLLQQENESSNIQSYVFYNDGTTVAVTVKGGYLHYILSDKYAGEEKITEETAAEKAKEFLEKAGYSSMTESYYFDEDGICTVNFAYTENDIIFYPDLIKVSVSLNDGSIVSFDAASYLMNHTEREFSAAAVTLAQARNAVADNLNIEGVKQAVIPLDDGTEKLTYEFLCSDEDGNDVLVYIDTETGLEADILLLLYSDGGTLTK